MCDFNLFRFKSEDCWSAFLRNYDDSTGPVSNLSAMDGFSQTDWSCSYLTPPKVSSRNNQTTLFPTPTQFVIPGLSTSANLFWAEQLLYFDLLSLKPSVIVLFLDFFKEHAWISCVSACLPYAADITINTFNFTLSPCVSAYILTPNL